MKLHIALLLGIAMCVPSDRSSAQQLARAASFTLDNDYFTFWLPPRQRSDHNYTHGARSSFDLARTPLVFRRIPCRAGAACGTTLELGQEMYTPTFDGAAPVPGERPYAGSLYGKAIVRAAGARRLLSIEMTAGVTGPASLAEASQSVIHKIAPQFRQPLGWDHQLPTEVAASLRIGQSWRMSSAGSGSRVIDALPSAHVTVGTLRTSLGGGGRVRIGPGLPHPWLGESGRRFTLYAFAGIRGEAVARDLFLDGATFQKSVRVDREPLLTEWERGFRLGYRRLALEYRAATRSREYATGPAKHTHASMGVHWMLR